MVTPQCRACATRSLSPVLDFGLMPPSRRFLTQQMASGPEPVHPLRLDRCIRCGLLQLDDESPPQSAIADALANREALLASDDPHGILDHLARTLTGDQVAHLDLPDLLSLHDDLCYDLICHETRGYYSVTMVTELAGQHGLELIDVHRDDRQLGKLSVSLQVRGGAFAVRSSVNMRIDRERAAELHRPEPWVDFATLVQQARDMLASELNEFEYRHQSLVAYTTGGRGMTMLAYCGAASLRLPFIIDEDPSLHGLLTPGHRIPIVGPERLLQARPEAVLLLGRRWDPEGEDALHDYWRSGGRILLPLPKPHYADCYPAPHLADRLNDPKLRDTIVPGLSFSEFA